MDKKVEIKKTVLDRKGVKDFIDSKFTFFKDPDPIVDNDTIEELFRLYDKLYLEIPIEGESPSHQYLVEQSSELYQVDKQLENIQPLLDEVASLRTQLLEANRNILELEAKLAGGGEISFADAEALALVRTELEAAQATIASLEQANTIANNATQAAQEQAKAQAEAAAEAAQTAATAAASTTAGLSDNAKELVNLLNKKRHKYYYCKRIIEKKVFRFNLFRRNRIYLDRYPWLYTETTAGTGARSYTSYALTSQNRRESRELTLDFFIEDARSGFTPEDIVAAVNKIGNFKGKVKLELQYDNDGNLDDSFPILWRLID